LTPAPSRGNAGACYAKATQEGNFPHRHFFPGLHTLIDTHLPPRRDITAIFAAAGFSPVIHQVVTQVTALEKSALRADSFLVRLPDDECHRGMASLRAHGDKIDANTPVTEEIDWFVFTRSRDMRPPTGHPNRPLAIRAAR
jgi:hypothetical protein